jgi:hypothetical protein
MILKYVCQNATISRAQSTESEVEVEGLVSRVLPELGAWCAEYLSMTSDTTTEVATTDWTKCGQNSAAEKW